MNDREKVLSGIMMCNSGNSANCIKCPYNKSENCAYDLTKDVNKLLDQLAQLDKFASSTPIKPHKILECGNCGKEIFLGHNYCPNCGKEIDWD